MQLPRDRPLYFYRFLCLSRRRLHNSGGLFCCRGIAPALRVPYLAADISKVSMSLSRWAMIPLVYPVTFLFRDESTAYVMTFSITLLIGLCSTLATYIYQLAEQMDEKVRVGVLPILL